MPNRAIGRLRPTLLIATAAAIAPRASGTSYTWKSTVSGNWSLANNWTNSVLPVSATDTDLSLAGSTTYTATNDLTNPFKLHALLLNDASAGQVISGSPLEFGTTDVFAGVLFEGNAAQVNNPLILDRDIFISFLSTTSTNVAAVNGAFSGSGRALLYGATNRTLVINGAGHTHAGTEIVGGYVTLGPAATLGVSPVSVTGSFTSFPAILVVPSATNIASGDGSLHIAGGNFVEFNSLANSAPARISADSDGVLALRTDTVIPASLSVANAPRLRIGFSSTNAAQVITFAAQLTPANNVYRFGGDESTVFVPAALGVGQAATNVYPILNVASTLADGAGNTPRSVNVGGAYLRNAAFNQQGKVRIANAANTYTGGTLVERNPGNNSNPTLLTFDFTPAVGQTPLGTGPLTVQGGLIFEGANGSLGKLPNAIVFQPGSSLVFNNLTGTTQFGGFNRDRWTDDHAIALNGTDLQMRVATPYTEVVGALSYQGQSSLTFTYAAGGTSTVQAASLARAAHGTLTIRPAVGDAIDADSLRATSTAAGLVDATTGMVHPSVVIDDRSTSTFGVHVYYASVDPSGFLRTYPFVVANPAIDTEVAVSGNTLAADETVWALYSSALNLGGKAMTIRSGGLIAAGGTISNGNLRFANGVQPVEALIYARRSSNNPIEITATITAAALTKFGDETLILSAPNAITGPVSVNAGIVRLNAAGAIPDGLPLRVESGAALVLNAHSLAVSSLTGDGAVGNNTVDNAAATLTLDNATDQEFGGRLLDESYRSRVLNVTKTGAGTFTLSGINIQNNTSASGVFAPDGGYGGLTTVLQGSFVAADRYLRWGAYQTAANANLTFKTDHVVAAIDGAGATVVGPGVTLTAARVRQASLDVQAASTVRVSASGGADASVSTLAALTLAADAVLDLTDNRLALDYASASPAATIRARLKSGYAAGAWTGKGIVSSTATATAGVAIGYAEAAAVLNLAPGGTGTWHGQVVDATTLLIAPTLAGDATLDGAVDFNDLVALAQNYNTLTGAALWSRGDFDYDGNVDFNDLVKLAQNYNTALPAAPIPAAPAPFAADWAAALATAAAVPEPCAPLTLLAAAALCPRRRRRRRRIGDLLVIAPASEPI